MTNRRSHTVGSGVLLTCGLLAVSAAGQDSVPDRGPAAIRRMTLSPDQVPGALERVKQGTLIRLPAAEFDRLARGSNLAREPVLVESRYRARFVAGAEPFIEGTAEWVIRSPNAGPTTLSLPGCQAAIRQARWSDGQAAVLYKLPADSHPSLRVPAGGDRTLNLDWSARGLPEPGEVRFELRLPAAPVAVIELTLPASIRPVTPQSETLLTGPFPSEAGTQAWRIAFGGASRLELVLRPEADAGSPLFVRLTTAHRLVQTDAAVRVELQVEAGKSGFAELAIDHDADLVVNSVTTNNLAGWSVVPAGSSRRVIVRLREATRSAAVVLTGTAPLPWAPARWKPPHIAVARAIVRSERMRLTVDSALRFRDWQAGGYRIVRAETGGGPDLDIELESAPVPAGRDGPAPPSLLVSPRLPVGPTVNQQAEWTVGPQTESWVVRTQGALPGTEAPGARFRVPPRWDIESVSLAEHPVAWAMTPDTRELVVRPETGSIESADASLVVRLRRPRRPDTSPIDLPDLYPAAASRRTGTLTVRTTPSLRATLSDTFGELPTDSRSSERDGLQRALTSEPLVGRLFVRPTNALPSTTIAGVVSIGRGPEVVSSRLAIDPTEGPVAEITLWTNVPIAEPWVWRDADGQRVADARRVPDDEALRWLLSLTPDFVLGPPITASYVGRAGGCLWRLQFPTPLTRLTALASSYAAADGTGGTVPVVFVMNVPFRGTIRVPDTLDPGRLDLRLISRSRSDDGAVEYRYGAPEVTATPVARPVGEIGHVRLTTAIGSEGSCLAELTFRVRNWADPVIAVNLPNGASAVAVRVAGRAALLNTTGGALSIPVPASAEWTGVSLRYLLPATPTVLGRRVVSPVPVGPFCAEQVQRCWHISRDWWTCSATLGAGWGERSLPPAPHSADEAIWVVSRNHLGIAVWGADALVVVAALTTRRRGLRVAVGLAAVLLGLGVLILLPAAAADAGGPLLVVGMIIAIAGTFRAGHRPIIGPGGVGLSARAKAVGPAVALLFGCVAYARAPESEEVWQVPGDGGRPAAVLAPPTLVERLRGSASAVPQAPSVVITQASYTGSLDMETARFRVQYHLYSFHSGPGALTLPMTGIRLRAATFDGGEPHDLQATAVGLRIPVVGEGNHVLTLEFSVPVNESGVEREVRFPIPEVPVSQLTFDFPAPVQRAGLANWRGAARTTPRAGGHRLEADLGPASVIGLRWQAGRDTGAISRVTGAAVWKVGTRSALLTGVFDYRVLAGSVSSVQFSLPPRTAVVRLVARGEPGAAGGRSVLVRDWNVRPGGDDGGQVLDVEFLTSVSGRVVLTLELVPSDPLPERVTLEFPRPVRAGSQTLHVAVSSAGDTEVALSGAEGLTEAPAEAFVQAIWKEIDGVPLAGKVRHAFRVTGRRPRLTATQPLRQPASAADETATWWAGPGRILGIGETRWTGSGLCMLEWTLPPSVAVTDVGARNLAAWSQTGGQVQAWFDRPVTDPVVAWRAVRSLPDGPARIRVPVAGHPSAPADRVTTRVRPLDGWVLDGKVADTLSPTAPGEIAWQSAGERSVDLRVLAPAAAIRLPVSTICHDDGSTVRQETDIDLSNLPPDRGHRVSMLVRTGDAKAVRVRVPAPVTLAEGRPEAGYRRWDLFVPPGSTPIITVSVAGPMPSALSQVRVRLAPHTEATLDHRFRLDPDHLALKDAFGLKPSGPGQWQADGPVWRGDVTRAPAFVAGGGSKERQHLSDSEPNAAHWPWPWAAAFVLWLVVTGFAVVRLRGTEPERAAGLGALTALVLSPVGIIFWTIPIAAAAWRVARIARGLRNRRRPSFVD